MKKKPASTPRIFGPTGGSSLILKDGASYIEQDLLDMYPEVTAAVSSETHKDYLVRAKEIKCNCCSIGRDCELNNDNSKTPVIYSGSSTAPIVIIGEAPGKNEWLRGIPFVGKSGSLLREFLHLAGFTDANIGFMNCVMCRPSDQIGEIRKDRAPTQQELKSCMLHLVRQLELVAPFMIICVGKVASSAFFGIKPSIPIEDVRGNPFVLRGLRYKRHNRDRFHHPVGYVTYHPASCLEGRDKTSTRRLALRSDILKANNIFLDPKSVPYFDGTESFFSNDSLVHSNSEKENLPEDTKCQ